MSNSTITFLVLGAVVVVFVLDHLPVAVVALGVALSLWATGVLGLDQALAGFGDPTVRLHRVALRRQRERSTRPA